MAPAGPIATRGSSKSNPHKRPGISPIIKIVHVQAPKVVRTDVANFRALVQAMTGNLSRGIHPEYREADSSTTSTSAHNQIERSQYNSAKRTNGTATTAPQRRRRSRTSGCQQGRPIELHPAATSSSAIIKRVDDQGRRDYDGDEEEEDDGDDDDCESAATSRDSRCERVRQGALHEFTRSPVDGFFADIDHQEHEHQHNNGDNKDRDRQGAADTCGYLLCSAYLPLAWRPAHEIPGGFDYFSF